MHSRCIHSLIQSQINTSVFCQNLVGGHLDGLNIPQTLTLVPCVPDTCVGLDEQKEASIRDSLMRKTRWHPQYTD